MISRRLIRIKVFKVLYSKINSGGDSIVVAENELRMSCEKTRDLYFFVLTIPVFLKRYAQQRVEIGLNKFHPTEEETNPNMKFIDNLGIKFLEEDKRVGQAVDKYSAFWSENLSVIKGIFNSLTETDYYAEYMSIKERSFADDMDFLMSFFANEIAEDEELERLLEDANIYWADDLVFVVNVINGLFPKVKEGDEVVHPEVFLKEEDWDYAMKLLRESMVHYGEYLRMITNYLHNWDTDRLASTDVSLIVMGITEAVAFPNIPIKVTINEYIELTKYYSTPNSKVFVNGILDRVIVDLQREGKIEKSGRGLVGS